MSIHTGKPLAKVVEIEHIKIIKDMESKILFSEKQGFRQWYLLLIFLLINAIFIVGAYQQIVNDKQFGDTSLSNKNLLITSIAITLFTVLFLQFRLETNITKEGIYVRFFPFNFKYKYYNWDSLKRCYVRKYSPLTEFGGWGYRLAIFGSGTAYSVSGNRGLQLELKNNRRLLIGTAKPTEMAKVLEQLEQVK